MRLHKILQHISFSHDHSWRVTSREPQNNLLAKWERDLRSHGSGENWQPLPRLYVGKSNSSKTCSPLSLSSIGATRGRDASVINDCAFGRVLTNTCCLYEMQPRPRSTRKKQTFSFKSWFNTLLYLALKPIFRPGLIFHLMIYILGIDQEPKKNDRKEEKAHLRFLLSAAHAFEALLATHVPLVVSLCHFSEANRISERQDYEDDCKEPKIAL